MSDSEWLSSLPYNPLPLLLSSNNKAVSFFASKDLLNNTSLNAHTLWDLPLARSIINTQQPNGSWRYPGGNNSIRSSENYDQIETFRNVGYLVDMFGFTKSNPEIVKAADFLFSFQTIEGDIRGILGNQYTPYYTAGMIELLIKAGYADDHRVMRAFQWLNSIRQYDGGWAIPLRTLNRKLDVIGMNTATLDPDRSKPFSHLVTGVVLRAYAAHATYCHSDEARTAGTLLLSSLFSRDHYTDRGAPDFWLRFSYPFWFTDLISATDSLTKLGFKQDEPQIQKALHWFQERQQPNGHWDLKTLKNKKTYDTGLWLDLSICRIVKRLYL